MEIPKDMRLSSRLGWICSFGQRKHRQANPLGSRCPPRARRCCRGTVLIMRQKRGRDGQGAHLTTSRIESPQIQSELSLECIQHSDGSCHKLMERHLLDDFVFPSDGDMPSASTCPSQTSGLPLWRGPAPEPLCRTAESLGRRRWMIQGTQYSDPK